jgi:protease I
MKVYKIFFLFSVFFLLSGCVKEKKEWEKILSGKKVVFILAEKNFRDEEYLIPKRMLQEVGAQTFVASTTTDPIVGMRATKVKPDMLLSDIDIRNFDAVIFVGGSGAQQYFTDVVALHLARECIKQNKVLGAICIAPVILANAGVLTGKRATVFPSKIDRLRARDVNYVDEDVIRDRRIITAKDPESAEKFGRYIIKTLLE